MKGIVSDKGLAYNSVCIKSWLSMAKYNQEHTEQT